jgi:hypothetical protein
MSGQADGTPDGSAMPDDHAADGDDHAADGDGESRRIWVGIVGLAIGIIAVSGALVGVLYDRDESGDDADDETPELPEVATESSFTWPAAYAGPVWITVVAEDAGTRTVTIVWGPWQRRITHATAEPVTYVFDKDANGADEAVPATVRIEPGADVEFGSGEEPPADAEIVNSGWTSVADDEPES